MSRLTISRAGHAYALDGEKIPSVTTVLGNARSDQFVGRMKWWAAGEVASWAATHVDLLPPMGEPDWIDNARKAYIKTQNKAKAKGIDVHGWARAALTGEPVEVPDEYAGHVRAAVDFMDTYNVQEIAAERPCANTEHRYGGTFDVLATLTDHAGKRETWLLDWKTGTGPWIEHALQVAAYAACDFYVDESGDDVPMPNVDRLGFVMLADESWDFVPVIIDRHWLANVFAYMVRVNAFVQGTTPNKEGVARWPVLGEPMPRTVHA